MMNRPLTIKTPQEIDAVSSSDKYPDLGHTRRAQLVTQITSAQGELAETLPVLLAHSGSALESDFIRDLLAEPSPEAPAAAPEPQPSTEQPAGVELAKPKTPEAEQ